MKGRQPVPQQLDLDGVIYSTVAAVANAINRTPRTCKKLLASGVLPEPEQVIAGFNRPGTRLYSQAEIDRFQVAAKKSRFDHDPRRATEFVRELDRLKRGGQELAGVPASSPIVTTSGQQTVRTWAEITGEEEHAPHQGWEALFADIADEGEELPDRSEVSPLPIAELDRCPMCRRVLLFDAMPLGGPGPRHTMAVCPVHGRLQVPERASTVTHGNIPATREKALLAATRGWQKMGTEFDHYGYRS